MRKSRFFSIIICLMLCVCTFGAGVWAAKTATTTTSGSISFTSNGVWAEVSGSISGAGSITNGSFNGTSTATYPTMEFDYRLAEGGSGTVKPGQSGVLPNWTSTNLKFSSSGGDITITINIKNMAPDRPLYAKIANNTSISNLKATMSGGDGNVIYIPAGDSTAQTFTIKLSLKDKTTPVTSSGYSFNIQLSLNELEKDVLWETDYTIADAPEFANTFTNGGNSYCCHLTYTNTYHTASDMTVYPYSQNYSDLTSTTKILTDDISQDNGNAYMDDQLNALGLTRADIALSRAFMIFNINGADVFNNADMEGFIDISFKVPADVEILMVGWCEPSWNYWGWGEPVRNGDTLTISMDWVMQPMIFFITNA